MLKNETIQENSPYLYGSVDAIENGENSQGKSVSLPPVKVQKTMRGTFLKSSLFLACSALLAYAFVQRINLDKVPSKPPLPLFPKVSQNEIDRGEVLVSVDGTHMISSDEVVKLTEDNQVLPTPLSTLDPVKDLHMYGYERGEGSSPSDVFGKLQKGQAVTGHALPTNKWYENILLLKDQDPEFKNQIYTVPYVIGVAGEIAGLKVSPTRLLAMDHVVQVSFVAQHSLTMGASHNLFHSSTDSSVSIQDAMHKRYTLDDDRFDEASGKNSPITPLGVTLKWNPVDDSSPLTKMSSSLVRGMPYATMHYHYNSDEGTFMDSVVPTLLAEIKLRSPPIVDSTHELNCTKGEIAEGDEMTVFETVKLTFIESDYTWLVYYSQPVRVRCLENDGDKTFVLQVTGLAQGEPKNGLQDDSVLTSRIALMNNCTHGTNPTHCIRGKPYNRSEYGKLLTKHSSIYPGMNTKIDYTFFSEEKESEGAYSYLQFEWDAQDMRPVNRHNQKAEADSPEVLIYSLPHQREHLYKTPDSKNSISFDGSTHCAPSLNGKACLVEGSKWVMKESLDELPSFSAPRPPMASSFASLANAINKDISYRIPDYYERGAGDTYFSGKMLAKLSRILLITEEMTDICSNDDKPPECDNISLPTEGQFQEALDHLRSSTEIWINGTATTPFVYDGKWGGIVSCGCYFNGDTMDCDNRYPNCPCFSDPGLDFGHGFYNDHHFHQGYHIYAAATIAHFDKKWGVEHYERVLLLIRDIANPSTKDPFFPTYRMKDWYLGNSWASGIARAYANGRNQESSSESIAAYEAVSLFGQVMAEHSDGENEAMASSAIRVRDVGRLLLATELRSADRYWHVRHSGPKSGIYPPQYTPFVVGIMWNLMAQFQTWFGAAPHLAIGIQLLPLTPISERRDDIDWTKELYPSFAKSCMHAPDCKSEGWGILQHAVLAAVGYPKPAIEYAESLPNASYTSAGGNGHSLTNTIWYYSTRPTTEPLKLRDEYIYSPTPAAPKEETKEKEDTPQLDCGCPETCTDKVLDAMAGGHTCGSRITWLMNKTFTENHACSKVGGVEFAGICAGCDPDRCTAPRVSPTYESENCPGCTREQCEDKKLNRCPPLEAPFLCTEGANRGGCSMTPWKISNSTSGSNCAACCEVTYNCQ